MTHKKKSFKEKLADSKNFPKVEKISPKLSKRWGKGTVVIPAPLKVDALMKKVPRRKVTTINEIRAAVAKKHKATIGCPITCGIFARIAAGAAEEDQKSGKRKITPYWRTLKIGGEINEKYPGGVAGQAELLKSEGHKVIKKGKKYIIEDYEKSLMKL